MSLGMEKEAGERHAYAPRRKNDPAGVRARILDSAYDLFQSRGYSATSVHEIAAAARVTGGALHHHFATKKAIGLAVIGERVGAALEETWLEPVRSAANARDGILGVLDTLARELDAQGSVRGCPVNNLTLELAFADADFRTGLRRLFDLWRSTIAERLAGRKDGEALAALVVAAYSGAMAMAKVEQRGEPLRLCARELRPLLSGA
jgi:TetR/AcrR family transcriptional regulator, transcriptional repressor for nem operon